MIELPNTLLVPAHERVHSMAHSDGLQDTIRRALAHAVCAPSIYNTQPWVFHVLRDGVELYADRGRMLHSADPQGIQLVMSCGAALYQLRLALRAEGYDCIVDRTPEGSDEDLLARVRCASGSTATDETECLLAAIPWRRTTRTAYFDRHIPAAMRVSMKAAAEAEGAWVEWIDDDERRIELANLVSQASRAQAADPQFRAELSHWLRSDGSRQPDGLFGHAMDRGGLRSWFDRWRVRFTDWGPSHSVHERRLAIDAPAIAVVGIEPGTRPSDWIRAGEGLAHMLLQGASDGLTASYLNAPLQRAGTREKVRAFVHHPGTPLTILRIGYGPTIPRQPRRSVNEVSY